MWELIFADRWRNRKIRNRKNFLPHGILLGDGNKGIEKTQEMVLYSLFALISMHSIWVCAHRTHEKPKLKNFTTFEEHGFLPYEKSSFLPPENGFEFS